jgi:SAM-dependent methyltransferase
MIVFDRRLVRLHRERAARRTAPVDFLFRATAEALVDRLCDIQREFPAALDLGCHGGEIARALDEAPEAAGRIGRLVQADMAPGLARRAAAETGRPGVAADEELLPFAAGSFDLILSNLSLHWVNDLPGALWQVCAALKPDGAFLAGLLGGDTLWELRQVVMEAELEVTGGASPRLSPVADLREAAGLLQRAGFALPVADADTITVTYDNAFGLLADLRGMGETNAGINRNPAVPPRAFWPEVARRYQERFAGPDGRIPATFQVISMLGWAPHETQPKPLRPGSARGRLADALGTTEVPTGDKAAPGRPKPGGGSS